MTSLWSDAQVRDMLEHFTHRRYDTVDDIAHEGINDGIGPVLILSIGIRESSLRNIVGDGGHGRGYVQIDDRSHQAWLGSHAGCKSGSWTPVAGHHALDPGYCPTLTGATIYAIELLRGNAAFARSHGVPKDDALHFAIAAYNCGAGNALRSYREGGIRNIDARTANRHYSENVLGVMPVVSKQLKSLGWRD